MIPVEHCLWGRLLEKKCIGLQCQNGSLESEFYLSYTEEAHSRRQAYQEPGIRPCCKA